MATYSQQCSQVGSFSYASNFTLYVQITERDSSVSSNTSVVDYNVFCQSNGSGSLNANHYLYFNLNGNTFRDETVKVNVSSPNAYIGITSGSMTVYHDSSGNASLSISAQIQASSYGVSASISDTFYCSKINRSPEFTSNPYVSSVTQNSITFYYGAVSIASNLYYSLNNSSWTHINSNPTTITGLSAGTTYTIYVQARNQSDASLYNTATCSGTTWAYPSFTSHYIASKTETSITVNWGCNTACDGLQYSLNGGSWTNISGYPTYTITGLSANTSYTIKTRARRSDYQIWGESGTLSTSTYAYPYANSMPKLTIGNQLKIGLYNPLGRNVSVYIIGANNAEKGGDTTTGTSITGYNNSTWVDWWYSTIPNANSGTYKVKVTYSGHTTTKPGTTYSTNVNECKPTFTNWEYEDTNETTIELTGSNQILVKDFSKVRGVVSVANKAIANKSASMTSYKLTIGNTTSAISGYSSSATVNVPILSSNGIAASTDIMTLYATDSRGNSTGVQKTATSFLNYSNVVIDKFNTTIEREGKVGSTVTLHLSGTFWNEDFGDTVNSLKSIIIQYKLTSENETAYINVPSSSPTITSHNFSLTQRIQGDLGADGYSPEKSFNIKVHVEDELSSAEYVMTLGTGTPIMSITSDGIGLGNPYEKSLGGMLQLRNKQIKGEGGGSWISARDNTLLFNNKAGQLSGYSFNSVWGQKTTAGAWCIGNLSGEEKLTFSYTTDSNYSANTNSGTRATLPVSSGTIQVPVSLYDNSSGTTGTVTLSETAANFTYLEIYYKGNSSLWQFVKVYNPNGKKVALKDIFSASSNTIIQLGVEEPLISGTSITRTKQTITNFQSGGVSFIGGFSNLYTIYTVKGYK